MEAESAARLSGEGEVVFAADKALDHVARTGYRTNDPRLVIGPVRKIKGDADLRQGRADAAIASYRQALDQSIETSGGDDGQP